MLHLFRRHVLDCPHELAIGVIQFARAFQLSQSKVQNLENSRVGDHEVAGFDIAMDHSHLVSILQSTRRLREDIGCIMSSQRSLPGDSPRKQFAFDQFHHQIMHSRHTACIKGSDDIGVHQFGDGANLVKEAFEQVRAIGDRSRKNF